MARKTRKTILAARRPTKPIDWDLVDDLLEAGCPGTEIAPHFDMHVETLYDRTFIEKNMGFTEYSLLKRAKGESNLRKAQYDKAIGNTDKGDNTLLIWLGKVKLNQKESTEVSVAPETMKSFNALMDQLTAQQRQINAENVINAQEELDYDE